MRTGLVVILFFLGCVPEREEDREIDPVSESVSAHTAEPSVDCSEYSDTGYVDGGAYAITLVTIDSHAVELETANAFVVMRESAWADWIDLRVFSGFRGYDEQAYLYSCYVDCSCNRCNRAAPPGYSNHQSGHAIDVDTSFYGVVGWLRARGGEFGFSETVSGEPWHWEFWGGGPGGGPCGRAAAPHQLGCGEIANATMALGGSLTSCGGRFTLIHQHDGNVVLYDNETGEPLWATNTDGRSTDAFVMQDDGNLVLYASDGSPLWASNTDGTYGAWLSVQDDGNMVIYSPRGPRWATNTVR